MGLGAAVILALNNIFLANLANATELFGINHGFYGIGGTIAPLIATSLASNGVHWSYFYCINLTLAACNLVFAGWAFRGHEVDMPLQASITSQKVILSDQPKIVWSGRPLRLNPHY